MFLTKVYITEGNSGMFYAGGYGAITRHEIPAGKTLFLDRGLFFAANDKTEFSLGCPGGCWGCYFGGEGLVMKFAGPRVIFSQNRDPGPLMELLKRPKQKEKKGKNAGSNVRVLSL